MLVDAQIKTFERDGYVIIRQLLDDDILQPVREVIGRYVDVQALPLWASGRIANRYEQAPFDRRWALIAEEYLRSPNHEPLARGWGGRQLLDPTVYRLMTDPRLTNIAASLMGPEITVNGDFWVRPKTPKDKHTTFTWHQDSFYYGGKATSDLLVLSVWIPLVDVDERNGCLRLIRGSQHFGPLESRTNEDGQREPLQDAARYGKPSQEAMCVGDVLAFHNLTLHASGVNSVPRHVRWNIDLRYKRTGQSFAWHSLGEQFERHYPSFTARSEDPNQVMSWKQWRQRWTEKRGHSTF